ncbi:CD63 antigen-like [Cydia pomonella]|uniref:CD63 antigen-like n=1 Tax=Cydia pomonella TaxID=82600 RepID=UPI002ADDA96F|nr:CD63 antigen-like [Cydia pomonella]
MAKEDFMKNVLYVVNIIYAVFGLATAITGIWFFVQLMEFVRLRNMNHYLLDWRVYWPQVAPWLFIVFGIMIIIIAFCGWCGAQRESRGILGIYGGFMSFLILFQVLSAVLIFVYVDGEDTDRFIKDTVYDGFYNIQNNQEHARQYEWIERKLKCCGANDARDYRAFRNDLPLSCCHDSLYKALCDFTDKEANERVGCAKVAAVYTKIISSSVAAASLLMMILEIVGVAIAWRLFHLFREVEHYIPEKKEGETEC